MIQFTSKLPQVNNSIFSVMSQLAHEFGAINLSQGFPDFNCSPKLIERVNHYMNAGYNQYTPMAGIPQLRERIAEKVNHLHGANYHPDTEVTVTAGGTQAIFTALAASINPNDEVIIFEPAYDSYAPTIKAFGGVVKSLELIPPIYKIDWEMVKRLVNVKTKMIIINSPKNPTGSVLTEDDIRQLITITKGTDILILSDEVYEHIIFDGRQHLSMARFPELQERSFICASFGKLLHTTGWKMGYCMAPEPFMKEFRKFHQFLIYSANTPLQYAIADFMADSGTYLELSDFYQKKRDYFAKLMTQTRFQLLPCHGSYFQTALYSKISQEKDTEFCKRLTIEYGVATIPVSAFYTKATDLGVIRFCFAKQTETLDRAIEKLIKI